MFYICILKDFFCSSHLTDEPCGSHLNHISFPCVSISVFSDNLTCIDNIFCHFLRYLKLSNRKNYKTKVGWWFGWNCHLWNNNMHLYVKNYTDNLGKELEMYIYNSA